MRCARRRARQKPALVSGAATPCCFEPLHPPVPADGYHPAMLLLGLLLFGLVIGAVAQLILRGGMRSVNWPLALVAGLVGSFIGGLLASLLAGDGLALLPSGIIGSIVGAIIVTAGYSWYQQRQRAHG